MTYITCPTLRSKVSLHLPLFITFHLPLSRDYWSKASYNRTNTRHPGPLAENGHCQLSLHQH